MMPGMQPGRVNTGDSSFLLVPKETGAGRLTERLNLSKELLTRYDRDKSGKLLQRKIVVADSHVQIRGPPTLLGARQRFGGCFHRGDLLRYAAQL